MSTRGGNFDLFLPFVEQGIRMLRSEGRMGIIAPSLWLLNEYGAPLRRAMHAGHHLDRWIDFKSHQIFDEAITYTALQFFTKQPNSAVRFIVAADGAIATNWRNAGWQVPYDELPVDDTWVFLPEPERRLVRRLRLECDRLGSIADIVVGIQTSADHIYHLQKLGPGRYRSFAVRNDPIDVVIEDAIMRPLVSGIDVSRYDRPQTETYLLFPYDVSEYGSKLINVRQMEEQFPRTWDYLLRHEEALRARENGSFDDSEWYRFGRNQNIDKQHLPKLAVPRLINRLFCAMDLTGLMTLDNVDVGGVLAKNTEDLPYIAALLNSPVLNFIWRGLSKPFQNDYRSANKQFIAPLPIPHATDEQKRELAERALGLEQQHASLHDLQTDIDRRLSVAAPDRRNEDWILPMLGTLSAWKRKAPASLSASAKTLWAKQQRERVFENELARMQTAILRSRALRADFDRGELRVLAGTTPIVDRIFVNEGDGPFIAALWQRSLQRLSQTASLDSARVIEALRKLHVSANAAMRQQVIALQQRVDDAAAQIQAAEQGMNAKVYRLFNLTDTERQLIEDGSK